MGRYMHPVGRGPAGSLVPREPFSRPWSTGKTVLLGLGDSVTAGYGATEGRRYFDLLVRNDDAACPDMIGRDLSRVFPSLEVINDSVSCTTSEEHLRCQVGYLQTFPKDVKGIVVITSGGNNIIHDYGRSAPKDSAMYGCTAKQASEWKENYREHLRGIIEGVNKRFPGGCDIFLANIYDPTDGVGDIHNGFILLPKWPDGIKAHAMFNRVIAQECDRYRNVHLVNTHGVMLGHGIHCRDRRNPNYRRDDPHYWYYRNLEDPNDRGYDAIRRVFLLKMIEVYHPYGPT
jgi:lysophospholipase L1-like esterase